MANGKTLKNGDMAHFARSGSDISIEYKNPHNSPVSGGQYGAKILIMAGKPL